MSRGILGLWSQIVGCWSFSLFRLHVWLLGKSWVGSKVMAMELTVEVGRANFRWKRNSLIVIVESRILNTQQRSYAGSRRCAAGVVV